MSKYKQVKVNFKPEDFAKLEHISTENGQTKAEFIRQRIGTTLDEVRQPKSKIVTSKADPKLLYHLHKIGNNLNQIATHANTQKSLDREILSSLIRLEEELKELL